MHLVRLVSPAWLSVLTALAILWSGEMAQANVRLESSGPPFYARIGLGEIYHDGEWATIAFYRNPVRPGFNLLEFFDTEFDPDCESYVAGFEIWKNGPWAGDLAPIQSRLNNTGPMPIWFVAWDELQSVIADGVLTIDELAGLDSLLIGTATFYTETLHPLGGGPQTKTTIVASGVLADGRTFSYQATGTKEENRLNHVKIEFK